MKSIDGIQVLKNSPGYGYVNIKFVGINEAFVRSINSCTEPFDLPEEVQDMTLCSDLMDAKELRDMRKKFEDAITAIDWCLQEKDGTAI